MLRSLSRVAFFMLAFFVVGAQASDPPGVGDEALKLDVEQWLQVPDNQEVTLEALRGQAVVLEFWATWCGPCVGAIPHINELAEEFADRPLRFLSVTDEDRETIEKFLKQRPIRGWVGLDKAPTVQHGYGISAIPTTILIDRQGRISGVMHPNQLDSEVLEKLLAGEDPGVGDVRQERLKFAEGPSEENLGEPLYQVLIRPILTSTEPGSSMSMSRRKLTLREMDARRVLTSLNDFGITRTVIEADLAADTYLVQASLPQGLDLKATVLEAALTAFGLEQRIEQREVDVLRVLPVEELGPNLEKAPEPLGSSSISGKRLFFQGLPIASLLRMLEYRLKVPVLDESGLSREDSFNATLEVPSWEREDVLKAVQEQLGLHLVPARRPLEVAVIRASDTRRED